MCFDGWYDDPLQTYCQKCRLVCDTCDAYSNCLTCKANRIGPADGNCPCPYDSLDREYLLTPWCATDVIAVPEIYLSDDLDKIVIDFGQEVTLRDMPTPQTFTVANCLQVFEFQTLIILGTESPKCAVNKLSKGQVIVELGPNSTVIAGSVLNFQINTIRFVKFNRYFTDFKLYTVGPPKSPLNPQGILHGPKMNVTLCENLILSLQDILNDGRKQLTITNWQLLTLSQVQSATVKAAVLDIMAKALQKNSYSIFIPRLLLENFGNYKFRIDFKNFVGLDGYAVHEFITSSNEAPTVEIDRSSPFVFFPQQTITLIAQIRHYQCSSARTDEIKDLMKGEWIITEQNTSIA